MPSAVSLCTHKRINTMYLVDWLQANLLMVFTVIVILGIPLVIGIIVFSNQSKKNEDKGPGE